MDDIDWSRIDKTKFFVHGLGLFSGVTTMLFPLSVIKTRQMASHGVSGGFQGTKQTAKMVWQSEGIPGFYRGFATVVFGTIPARTIYLTSLEITKSAMQRMGKQLQLSDTTTAGVSNFAAGACASLSTQLVTVPIDVVSQRQMVHGADISSITRAASRVGSGVRSTSTRGAGGMSSGNQSMPPSSHSGGQVGVSGAQANTPASSSSSSTSMHGSSADSTSNSSSSSRGVAYTAAQQQSHPPSSTSTSSSSSASGNGGPQSSPLNSTSSPNGSNPSNSNPSNNNSRHFSSTSAACSSSRGCVMVPNRGGLASCSMKGGGQMLLDRGSAWGASSSLAPGRRGGGSVWDLGRRMAGRSRCLSDGASSTSTSTSAAQSSQTVPSGLQIARLILKQEGPLGLYRGFGMSVATFVPSSAVWWSAYGVYQQLVAHAYTSAFKATPTTSSSTSPGTGAGQVSGMQASQQDNAGGAKGALLSTAEIMAIQTGSSMLAGATSSLITNPLDLIKTRIQVAYRHEGQPTNFRSVITEIVAEDGPFGLFRGVLPRMANAALWGTCMVTVYEFLRRVSRKEPDQE